MAITIMHLKERHCDLWLILLVSYILLSVLAILQKKVITIQPELLYDFFCNECQVSGCERSLRNALNMEKSYKSLGTVH